MLKAIHASEDLAAAREKAIRVIGKLRGLRLSRAAELVEAAVEETLITAAIKVGRAVDVEDWPSAGTSLNRIRQIIRLNLPLGLVVVVIGGSGRYWG
jgi:uncharacterized membrane protein